MLKSVLNRECESDATCFFIVHITILSLLSLLLVHAEVVPGKGLSHQQREQQRGLAVQLHRGRVLPRKGALKIITRTLALFSHF